MAAFEITNFEIFWKIGFERIIIIHVGISGCKDLTLWRLMTTIVVVPHR